MTAVPRDGCPGGHLRDVRRRGPGCGGAQGEPLGKGEAGMSWEAWGSGDMAGEPYEEMEGWVREETHEEEMQCSHEARVLLKEALWALSKVPRRISFNEAHALVHRIHHWMDANTPKVNQSETWRDAVARQVAERGKPA